MTRWWANFWIPKGIWCLPLLFTSSFLPFLYLLSSSLMWDLEQLFIVNNSARWKGILCGRCVRFSQWRLLCQICRIFKKGWTKFELTDFSALKNLRSFTQSGEKIKSISFLSQFLCLVFRFTMFHFISHFILNLIFLKLIQNF